MTSKEIELTESNSVSCQGREAPYDHPLVYLEIKDDAGRIDCPYCGKEFVLKRGEVASPPQFIHKAF